MARRRAGAGPRPLPCFLRHRRAPRAGAQGSRRLPVAGSVPRRPPAPSVGAGGRPSSRSAPGPRAHRAAGRSPPPRAAAAGFLLHARRRRRRRSRMARRQTWRRSTMRRHPGDLRASTSSATPATSAHLAPPPVLSLLSVRAHERLGAVGRAHTDGRRGDVSLTSKVELWRLSSTVEV